MAGPLCLYCARIFGSNWQPNQIYARDRNNNDSADRIGVLLDADSYRRSDWLQSELDGDGKTVLQPFKHHLIADLESSALTCKLCDVFWEYLNHLLSDLEPCHSANRDRAIGIVQVRPAFDDLDDISDTDDVNLTISDPNTTLEIEVSYFVDGKSDSQEAFLPLTIGFDLLPADKWQDAIASVPNVAALVSDDTLKAIGNWAAECQNEHIPCWRSAEAAFKSKLSRNMPTRVLHIRTDSSGEFKIHLVETTSLQPGEASSDYITLSHCWGGFLPIRLLESNYVSFSRNIEIQDLPKTFRDAITFTQACGIRYIWIDALCIIQDSKTDWLKESLLMVSVYSFAYLNIAATSAHDGQGGLFVQEDKRKLASCVISATWGSFPTGDYVCLDSTTWERRIELGPLNKRAWVFQERLLAPRTVHFAKDQIWWECRSTRANECFPYGVPDYVFDMEGRFVEQLTKLDDGTSIMSNEVWLSIVQKYTQAHLTKDVDRLIALAGVALVVQETLHWSRKDYCAGLWKHDLLVDLLWQASDNATRKQSTYVAPSWSWASVNGEVFFGRDDDRAVIRRNLTAKIESIFIDTAGDEFGLIKNGMITLRARLYPATFLNPEIGTSRIMKKLKFGKDEIELVNGVHFYEYLDDKALYEAKSTATIIAAWCVISTFATPHLPDQYSTHGLILQEVAGSEPGLYKRIGWSRIVHNDSDTDLVKQLSQQFSTIGRADSLNDGWSRIKIV